MLRPASSASALIAHTAYAPDDPRPVPGGASPTDASSTGPPSQWCVRAARRIGWRTSPGRSASSHSRCLSTKRLWKRAATVMWMYLSIAVDTTSPPCSR